MKGNRRRGGAGAFTLLELLSVTAVIIVLAALLLPALENVRAQAKRAQCVSRLRQIGVGFQSFAHDHNGLFPMALPASAGGTLEFAASGRRLAGDFSFSFRHLQSLSNELVTPQLLVCPADTRLPCPVFGSLQNSNLSYFVGINASYAFPDSILAGDRNVTNDWTGAPPLARLGGNYSLRWTRELHRFKGNLLFADGRVEQKNTTALKPAAGQAPLIAVLALPVAQPSAWHPPQGSGAPVTRPPDTASPGTASPADSAPLPKGTMVVETVPPNPIGGTALKASAAKSDQAEAMAKSSPSRSGVQPGLGNQQAAAPAGRVPQPPYFYAGAPTPVQVLVGAVAGVLFFFLLAVLATALASHRLVRGVTWARSPALPAGEQKPVNAGRALPRA